MTKKYEVTVRATITKTLEIEANSEEEAIEEAHQVFSILPEEDEDEEYEQETIAVSEVE